MKQTPTDRQALLQEFDERGFLIIPGALSTPQLATLNRALDRYESDFPQDWVRFDEALIQTINVLPRVTDFDCTIENPMVLDLLRGLIGDDLTFEELSLMIRNPSQKSEDIKGWHRDTTRDYNRRMEIKAISAVYYLTDVGESDHCFSIIPGTHNRLVDMKPEEVAAGTEFDIKGPAGTALLFHTRCLHTGRLKANSRQRRTVHVYFSRAGEPRVSEWSDIPARLHEKKDPSLPPKLYSKWNVKDVFEGTGKKPRDLDPNMSTADMLKEVQLRAKRRM